MYAHTVQMQAIRDAFVATSLHTPERNRGAKRRGMHVDTRRQGERSRSPPPSPTQQHSPRKRRLYSPVRAISNRRPSFPAGASSRGPSACAICLGRHRHEISKCCSETLWNGEKARCHRNDQGRLVSPAGLIICSDWQRPNGCSTSGAGHRHECSGCGKNDHGAQECPRTQKD